MKEFLKNKRNIVVLALALVLLCTGVYFFCFRRDKGEQFRMQTGFENGQEMLTADAWKEHATEFGESTETVHDGGKALMLTSAEENDARYTYSFKAKANTYYKVSCWMKTEDVGLENTGANLSLEYCYFYFGDLRGTQDWTYVEGYFRVLEEQHVKVMLRLGGYSSENSGTVYFDNFAIEELSGVPSGMDPNTISTVGSLATSQEKIDEQQFNNGYIALFLMLSLTLFLIYRAQRASKKEPFFQGQAALFILFAAALLLRLVGAMVAEGFEGDVWLFQCWGDIMSENVSDFYVEANAQLDLADYPPFYMYVLGLVAKIVKLFGISLGSSAFRLAIKTPPLLADLVCAFFIYRICEKLATTEKGSWLKGNWSLFFAGIYLFNPMILMDSVVWGQMDSFLTMFMLFAVYAVMQKKVTLSAVLFAVCILIKPQGLFAGPVLLYYVIREGKWKKKIANFFKCAGAILGTIALLTLPYMLHDKTIWFLPKLFAETAGRYDYASVNGFNLFSLLGLNWVQDTGNAARFFGIEYYSWGILLLGTIVIVGGLLYCLLPKDYAHKEILIATFLICGIFNFTVRMHERYLFPAILLSLVVAILDNSRFMLRVHGLLTTTSFFNAIIVLGKYTSGQDLWAFEGYKSITYVSAANVLAFILILIYVILKICKRETAKIGITKEELADESDRTETILG